MDKTWFMVKKKYMFSIVETNSHKIVEILGFYPIFGKQKRNVAFNYFNFHSLSFAAKKIRKRGGMRGFFSNPYLN